jgi:ubiquitin-conjugating enzyme E2 Z
MTDSPIVVSKNIKRLLHDVRDIMKNPLTDNGIYYVHSDKHMFKGYAFIIGPEGTPYENGYYFFEFTFTENYPFSPPKLTYLTNDGVTRFNPNLYKSGKVCLSILNTWEGEQWTSCQNISSILLTLSSIFNNNPLTNEPGYTDKSSYCNDYKECIRFMNIKTAIIGIMDKKLIPYDFHMFYHIIKGHFEENKEKVRNNILSMIDSKYDNSVIHFNLYSMKIVINYNTLKHAFDKL